MGRGESPHHGEGAALAAQHPSPQPVGVGGDGIVGLRRNHIPRAFLDLRLELAGIPTGITGEEPHADDRLAQVTRVGSQIDGAQRVFGIHQSPPSHRFERGVAGGLA